MNLMNQDLKSESMNIEKISNSKYSRPSTKDRGAQIS